MTTAASGVREPRRSPARSAAAVVAGIVVVVVTTSVVDGVLHATGVYPPLPQRMADSLFPLALSYRVAFNVVGGYVTARLAPTNPVRHSLVLGGIGVVAGAAGAVAMWDKGPAWYNLAVIAIALPTAWLGSWLFERHAGSR